jgi:phosphoribosylamine--glycine ligase
MPLLRSPLELLFGAATGELKDPARIDRAALGVVMASEGYPQAPRTGDPIKGLGDDAGDVHVCHAGTRTRDDGAVVTAGGRVLTVVGLGSDLREAREKAYAKVGKISFRGEHHRTDIGSRALL